MVKRLLFSLVLSVGVLPASDILALVGALDRNDTAAFKTLVKTIEDANTLRVDNNKTVLMYACWVGNVDAVKHLLSKGADVNASDAGGATALHLALWKGYDDIALLLLDNGASVQSMSQEGMTPLDIAIMRENRPIIDAISKAAPKLKPLW